MFSIIVLLIAELLLLAVLLLLFFYFLSRVISTFFDAPFVPTNQKMLAKILQQVKFRKKDVFYDLGCGDGRVVFYVADRYQNKAIGVERNPLLYLAAQAKKVLTKRERVEFIRQNIFDVNLSNATIIYLFLFPETLVKLKKKIAKECRTKTRIISHGFKIKGWEKYLTKTLKAQPFSTYYYSLL